MILAILVGFLSSFLIVKAKLTFSEPSFIINKTKDIKIKDVLKLVVDYNSAYNYYYKYSIVRTYHAGKWNIYTTNDTLSTELKKEEK